MLVVAFTLDMIRLEVSLQSTPVQKFDASTASGERKAKRRDSIGSTGVEERRPLPVQQGCDHRLGTSQIRAYNFIYNLFISSLRSIASDVII